MGTIVQSALFLVTSMVINTTWAEDLSFTNSYEDCQSFADQFDNTCSSLTTQYASVASVPAEWATCSEAISCPSTGTSSGDSCTYRRRLCVTCFESGDTVMIRVQTNGMPNHCWSAAMGTPEEQDIDWQVEWMRTVTEERSESQVTDLTGLNELLCNIYVSSNDKVPSEASFEELSTADDVSWGIAVTGTSLFNGVSLNSVDPFYPAVYGTVTDPDSEVEVVDWCLCHPQTAGVLHYHSASTCIPDSTYWSGKTAPMSDDAKTIMQDEYQNGMADRAVLGLSKDGRVIYTPFYSGGQEYSGCDLDVCNGMEIDGHYAYVSTLTHPYIMGCYGPGSVIDLEQTCSTNPRTCSSTDHSVNSLIFNMVLILSTVTLAVLI